MKVQQRIEVFIELGKFLRNLSEGEFNIWASAAAANNRWFTAENVKYALEGIVYMLEAEKLKKWIAPYQLKDSGKKKIGVVMAGNIPLVGFHDFLSVLMSGHVLYAKLSKDDNVLLKKIVEFIVDIEPAFQRQIIFADRLNEVDAVIATGSNNTARYFEYYFSKLPRIIRKNRTSMAILSGNESTEDLVLIGKDIFQYFGLGCRNVSKIFVPETFSLIKLMDALAVYQETGHHNKYANNYDYNKAMFLLNKVEHYDTGFLLLKEDTSLFSSMAVLHYQKYKDISEVNQFIAAEKENIQCVVSSLSNLSVDSIPLGRAQSPDLWDYADGVDTMKFLEKI